MVHVVFQGGQGPVSRILEFTTLQTNDGKSVASASIGRVVLDGSSKRILCSVQPSQPQKRHSQQRIHTGQAWIDAGRVLQVVERGIQISPRQRNRSGDERRTRLLHAMICKPIELRLRLGPSTCSMINFSQQSTRRRPIRMVVSELPEQHRRIIHAASSVQIHRLVHAYLPLSTDRDLAHRDLDRIDVAERHEMADGLIVVRAGLHLSQHSCG